MDYYYEACKRVKGECGKCVHLFIDGCELDSMNGRKFRRQAYHRKLEGKEKTLKKKRDRLMKERITRFEQDKTYCTYDAKSKFAFVSK